MRTFAVLCLAHAGVVRRAGAGPTSSLCDQDDIRDTCAAMGAGGQAGLGSFMTATAADTAAFVAAAGLGASFSCKELCQATLAFSQTADGGHVGLPPHHALVCADPDCTETASVTSAAVQEMAMKEIWQQEERKAMAVTEKGSPDAEGPDVHKIPTDIEPQPDDLTFTPREMARSLLVLFDIFPTCGNAPSDFYSMLEQADEVGALTEPEFGPRIQQDRYRKWTMFAAKGQALLATAIKRVERRPGDVARWFGDAGVTRDVKQMFQKQLKTMLDMQIKKGDCEGRTLAYVLVWTNTQTGAFVKSDRDRKGQYVVHVCEYFWSTVGDTDYRYGTLVHEAAHHHGPTDVTLASGNTAYGRRGSLQLVREQGPYGDHSPEQGAMNNADNYMNAVLVLASDQIDAPLPSPREPERPGRTVQEWHPAERCATECGATAHMGRSLGGLLEASECAACYWATQQRYGGTGCGEYHSLGTTQYNEVCCLAQECTLE